MNQLTVERTPQVIAAEIDSIKGQARNVMVLSSIEIGRRLIEAKELVPHGEWGKWLEESVDYSQSTANNLMQLYREYGDGKIPTLGNLSYTKAVALLGVPAEEREQFVQENDVEGMSARELKQLIKEKEKLEKLLEKNEKQAEKDKKAAEMFTKQIESLEADLKKAIAYGKGEEVQQLSKSLEEAESKVKLLEKQLKDKPIEVSTVEVVPEAVEKELEELRKQVAQTGSPASLNFRFQFEALTNQFRLLLEALDAIPDAAEQVKYKKAVNMLIQKMGEPLK